MNILFISSDNYSAAGDFLSMTNLILELREKWRINSFVILPVEQEGGKELLDKHGISYEQIKSYNWTIPEARKESLIYKFYLVPKKLLNLFAIGKICKIASRENANIIHINTMCTYIGYYVSKIMKLPLVWHIREYMEEDQKLKIWNRKKNIRLINSANAIITVSYGIQKKYQEIFEQNHTYTIFNGISPTSFFSPKKEILNDEMLKIVLVGKICENKGQFIAVKAIKRYIDEVDKNIVLKIVGTGDNDYLSNIQQYIFQNKLEDNVYILGNKSDVKEYYEWADICLMCSKCEAFGRVTVEAMLMGCLVIGCNTGGTSELLENNVTGLLFEPYYDEEQLFKKIYSAHKDSILSKKIADNGRKIAIEKYTAENNAKEIVKIYNKILNA